MDLQEVGEGHKWTYKTLVVGSLEASLTHQSSVRVCDGISTG